MADRLKICAPKLTPLEKRLMLDASLPAIAGQVLWLDAADASTIRDADGDNAATGTGGANNGFSGTVRTWADKSGSGFNVTNNTANQQPVYNSTGLNGKGVITFDGSNDKLTNTSAAVAGNDHTTFVVFNRTLSAGRDAVFELGSGTSRNAIFINEANNNRINYYVNSTFYNSSSTYTAGTYEMVSIVHDINTATMYRGGTSQFSGTTLTRAGTTGIFVGDDSSGGDELQGNIAEIIVYDRDLTSDERRDVENYLASKWGITTTNTAPILATNTGATVSQSDPVTITSAMLNATDADNTDSFLRYTITDLSDYGSITNTNTSHTYVLGEYFTQGDIDNGYIRYTHGGTANFTDSFSFTVTDQYATTAAATFNLTITPDNVAPQFQGWTLVSSEDFQANANGWSDTTRETSNPYLTTFLGRHSQEGGAQNTFKTYTMTGTQDYTVITFDMYKIDSWDGEFFRVFINDAQVINLSLIQNSFQQPADGSSGIVSYTVQELTPFAANFAMGSWNDQIFRFTLTVQNSAAATLKLGFSSTLDQAVTDESWGVDNINIYEVNEGGTTGPIGIVENSPNGTVVGRVTATDANAGQTITYSISGGTGAGVFAINATTGVITVINSAALDYETTTSYTLDVVATDNGTPAYSATQTMTINVINLPENTAPTLAALGPFTIGENTANGTILGTASGSDVDGHTLTYSITAGNTDNIFAINATTGAIRVNSNTNLNYQWDNSYTLTVQVQDNGFGNLTATRNVIINVTDVNEAPTFNVPQSFLDQNPYLRYNAATGNFYRYIGTTATYAAATTAATGMLLNGVAGHIATISSAAENSYVRGLGSGALWLAGSDLTTEGSWVWGGTGAEAGQVFSIGSTAQGTFYTNWVAGQPDDSGNSDYLEMLASGQWTDVVGTGARAYVVEWEGSTVLAALGNTNPMTLAENPALNQSVGFVHARDPDIGDTLAYSITGGSGAAHFAVNSTTGEITVTNPSAINYESATSFTLDIQAQDAGGLTGTTTVTINITDVNEAPVLSPAGPFTVSESAAVNTVVGTVSASDVDGNTITYSITGGNALGIFSINASGQIRIANTAHLDYELNTTHTLTIRATDNGTGALFDTKTVTINVSNVNEGPSFDAVQRVLNSDPTLHYSANTGNFYRFVSGAANYATASANASAAILNGFAGYIVNINSLAESNFLRTIIPTTIWMNGSDATVEGEWRFTGGPDSGDIFWLGASGGSAQNGHYTNWSAGEPNNSGGNEDYIEFRTNGTWNDTNGTGLRAYVIEWDGADVLASLQNGPFSVDENSAVNTTVGSVLASDPEGGAITYSITGGTGSGLFSINNATGAITLIGPVNYEAAGSYTLDLRAEDPLGLFDALTITININDINEAPVLSPAGPFTVSETAANNTIVGVVSASDVDSGQNLSYSITAGNTHGIFSISNSGTIRILKNTYLDYELQNSYTLTIRATDNGIGALFDSETVTINVTNVNEAPSFDPVDRILSADPTLRYNAATGNFYRFVDASVNAATANSAASAAMLNGIAGYLTNIDSAAENAFVRNLILGSSWITGSDSAVEGEWRYNSGPNAGDLFWLGTAGGSAQNGYYTNWTSGQPNNSGNQDSIEMQTNGLWNDAASTLTRAYVIEWNGADVLASLQHGPYNVPEHSALTFSPGSALASDFDAGDTITYSITGGSGSGIFSIDAATGAIRLSAPVNYEVVNSYTLDLRVQDSAGLFDTMSITVNITDQNDVPSALNLSGNHITENSGAGVLIGLLSTADEDPADTHIYTLVTNPSGKFSIVGNELRTAADIDYEQNQSFTIILRVDDGNGGIMNRSFLIQVGDVMDTNAPPPASNPSSPPDAYAPPEVDEQGGSGNILGASLNGEQNQSLAFYGEDGLQILRENITFRIRDILGLIEEEEKVVYEGMSDVDTLGALLDISDEAPAQPDFTNIREALKFLQQMADSKELANGDAKDGDNDARAEKIPQSAIDRQFVDVMTYHQDRAARLREALMG